MRTRQVSEEVLFTTDRIVKVGRQDIDLLKKQSVGNRRQRIRLCTHQDVADDLHEMFIVHPRHAYIRPHKRQHKAKSYHVIQGVADMVLFDEEGAIVDHARVGDLASGLPFYFRFSEPHYLSILVRSEHLVFHETMVGPYVKGENILAPWAPEEGDTAGVEAFMEQIERQVQGSDQN